MSPPCTPLLVAVIMMRMTDEMRTCLLTPARRGWVLVRAGNDPSRSLKFLNHREGPYKCLLALAQYVHVKLGC